MSNRLPAPPKKILVCQLRQIGDVILSTPAVRLLKEAWPGAQIHFFTEKKCAPVLENNPDIHKIWKLDRKELTHLGKELPFYWKVARQNFDLAIDFQQLPRIRWVMGFSGAPVRLSYSPPWYTSFLYTDHVRPLDGYSAMAKASVLRAIGLEWNGEKPGMYLTQDERDWAQKELAALGLKKDHALVTIDPTHRRKTRCWPAQKWAELLDLLGQSNKNMRFLLLYGPGEKHVIDELAAKTEFRERVIVPNELYSLREMASIIEAARLHVGNCSAPRHMAVALDTPTFTVLGATSPAWTFPSEEHTQIQLGLDCQPCNQNSCSREDFACLEQLEAKRVHEELLNFTSKVLPKD